MLKILNLFLKSQEIQSEIVKEIVRSNFSNPIMSNSNVLKGQIQDPGFYLYLKHIALLVAIILMFVALAIIIFCILKYKKTVQTIPTTQNENIIPKKNIFKRIWDMRLKKKIDDRVYGNFLHKTDSEISHVSNNSNIELCSINNQKKSC